TNLATTCNDTLTNGFTFIPANQSCIVTPTPPTAPTASFTFAKAGLVVTFANGSTGSAPLTYAWNFGDGGTSAAQNPTHTYAVAGNYVVSLTVSNSAGTSTTNQ